MILLSYENFIYSEWESDPGEKLTLHFATHEVTLTGRGLRRIEYALQRKELSWVSELPAHLDQSRHGTRRL